jgi:hypothetical protein
MRYAPCDMPLEEVSYKFIHIYTSFNHIEPNAFKRLLDEFRIIISIPLWDKASGYRYFIKIRFEAGNTPEKNYLAVTLDSQCLRFAIK